MSLCSFGFVLLAVLHVTLAAPQQQSNTRPTFMVTPFSANTVSATCTGHFSQYFLWPSVDGQPNVVTSASLDAKSASNAFTYANDVSKGISYLGGGIWPGQYITPNGTFFHYPTWAPGGGVCLWLPGWDIRYENYRKTTATWVGYLGDANANGGRIGVFSGSVGDPGNGPKNINFRAEVDMRTSLLSLVTYSQLAPKYVLQPVGNPMYVEGQVSFEECTQGAPAANLVTLPDACNGTPFLYMCPGNGAFAPCPSAFFYTDNEYVPSPFPSKRSVTSWEQRQALLEERVRQFLQGPVYNGTFA
jgi:hypothetical protein